MPGVRRKSDICRLRRPDNLAVSPTRHFSSRLGVFRPKKRPTSAENGGFEPVQDWKATAFKRSRIGDNFRAPTPPFFSVFLFLTYYFFFFNNRGLSFVQIILHSIYAPESGRGSFPEEQIPTENIPLKKDDFHHPTLRLPHWSDVSLSFTKIETRYFIKRKFYVCNSTKLSIESGIKRSGDSESIRAPNNPEARPPENKKKT